MTWIADVNRPPVGKRARRLAKSCTWLLPLQARRECLKYHLNGPPLRRKTENDGDDGRNVWGRDWRGDLEAATIDLVCICLHA